ncbi:MAG: helix-turn-helix transcriptional regulator [Clostridium argentinense]|uniref:Helix-turn-helix transcriptional regulator n=1 Tax=Clostridium faecium TaxID=2762223 RepID=A0ABR8YVH2_9CLOT|nr:MULTISPECIES: winged helix-turn-helix domain-containing protein [Clostridium]MBD8048288.1 helix-turn-helix transcriptional regulator [Clostridium faecium]MBS5823049.1 helix-turn-helix transcriptional regulator [Clostridium argentinense]MDU1349209.1 winged helix-turn-helix domain-containing protein [Clostridium argentinense]
MEDRKVLTTLEEVKAISDPFRYRIIITLIDINEPASVRQISDKMNEMPSKIYYHIKKLEKVGIVHTVDNKKIKGNGTKYYELLAKKFEIRCSKEIDEPYKIMHLALEQRMISNFYDNSKEVFLSTMNSDLQGSGGTIMSKNIYLAEEEADEIIYLMRNFLKNHKEEDYKKLKYHVFFTIIEE